MGNVSKNSQWQPINVLVNEAVDEFIGTYKFQFETLKKVPVINKIKNERKTKRITEKFIENIKPYKKMMQKADEATNTLNEDEINEFKSKIIDYMSEMDKIFFESPFLANLIKEGFLEASQEFFTRGKKGEPSLSNEELSQAARNVWIVNSLQSIWSVPIHISSSIYAYSIIYPYTDNFLDDPDIDNSDKVKFNDNILKVINGEDIKPSNFLEEKVFSLLKEIESQYPRSEFPGVYYGLRLIQEAQIESVKQNENTQMAYGDILPISFFKGGTSVLADGFLVKGSLNKEEMQFAFKFGTFLQLIDDIQDIEEDSKNKHQTIYSIKSSDEKLDLEVERLISYIFRINESKETDTKNMSIMKEVIKSSLLISIMVVIGKNPKLVTKGFYKKFNSYSKVRLGFYSKLQTYIKNIF